MMINFCPSALGQVCQVEYALAILSMCGTFINLGIIFYILFYLRKINNYLESNREDNENHLNEKKLKIYYVSSTKWCSSLTKLLYIFGLLLELASAWLKDFSSNIPNVVLVGTSFLLILSTIWRRYAIQSRVKLKKISSAPLWFSSLVWLLISAAQGWRLGYILPTASWTHIQTTSSLVIAFSSLMITILEARQAVFWRTEQQQTFISRGAYTHHLSSIPSKITFWWILPLFRCSFKGGLTFEDLGELPETESSQIHYQNFNLIYNKYRNQWGGLWNCYWHFCRRDWLLGGFLKFLGDLATMMGPIGLAVVVEYVSKLFEERTNSTKVAITETASWSLFFSNAYTMATLSFLVALAQGSLSQASTHLINVQAIRLKNALQTMIYVKSLRLPTSQGNDENMETGKDPGFVTNLVSEDAFNIMSAFCVGHYIWAIPLKVFLLVYLLYRTLGFSGVLGALACVTLLGPIQYCLAKKMASNGRILSSSTDERIRLVHEGIRGARILKLHGWECWQHNRVSRARQKEIELLNKDSIYWAISTLLVHGLTVLVALTTFAFREYLLPKNDSIRASQVFAGLALFNQLAVPLFIIPAALPILVSALVSTRRLESFLKIPEISSPATTAASSFCSDAAFIISPNSKFGWTGDGVTLSVPQSIRIPIGKLTVLVGSVGSGKTSLMAALLNEILTLEGQVLLQRGLKIAYCAQQVWLASGSVRDNITDWSASNENPDRYKNVISYCALEPDLAILPGGDTAKLGADEEAKNTESGIVLSGGQKQRVALARALYSQADILLLDDPISALDEQVAMHVFEQGIRRFAIGEENRTIVMSSHRPSVLKEANQIIVFEEGGIRYIAKEGINEIKDKDPKLYYSLLQSQEHVNQPPLSPVPREVYTRTARERWQLIRLVSKIGLQLKHHLMSQENDEESNSENDLVTDGFRRRAGTGTSDGIPRYLLVHELPPTHDWWCAKTLGSRRSTLKWKRDLNQQEVSLWRSSTLQPRHQNHSSYSFSVNSIPKAKRVRRQHSTPAMLALNHSYTHRRPSLIRRLFVSTSNLRDVQFCLAPEEIDSSINHQESISDEKDLRNAKCKKEGWFGYITVCGWLSCFCYGLTTLTWQGFRVFTDYWLTRWTDNAQQKNQEDNLWFFERYAWLILLSLIFSAGSHGFGFWAGARGRSSLHERLAENVLVNATPKWLSTTPFGKLADRFSTDMAIVDKKLCPAVQRLSQFGLLCASAIFVNICIAPWFLVAALPISVAYYFIQRIYRTTSQQIQSLDALGRGPVLGHLSDTLLGRATIRAFGQQHKYTKEFIEKLDRHVVAYLILDASGRWLGIALDYIGAFIVFLSSLATIAAACSYPERVTPSLVGLAINYTLLVPVYLNWVVKFAADVDIYMSAADRVYACIESVETEQHIGDDDGLKVEEKWPQNGEIHFDRVTLRYGPNLEPIITNLTLHIPSGQKVGIVGRTGSGKSTLLMSLFGMVHVESPPGGGIRIDGVDIKKLTACTLRSRLAAIPQDSIIFSGSIRDNLDPKKKYSDDVLWNSLEMVQLKELVKSFSSGLDSIVTADTFGSAGEHQLLTVARAFLRGSKCVTLDEATAALDAVTEKRLLKAIRHAFEGNTIVAVAHRVSTLLECDRLLVLEAGQGIVEDGHPEELLARPASRLHSFLDH